MNFKKYESKQEFLNENLEILLREEAKNELMLGITLEHDDDKVSKWFLGRIENNNEVKIVFLVDDDKKGLVFYVSSKNIVDEELELLVNSIINYNVELRDVCGNIDYAYKIAKIYCEKSRKEIFNRSLTYTLKLEKIKQEHVLNENEKLIKLNPEHADMKKMSQIVKDIHTDITGVEACSDEEAVRIANIYLKKGLYILTDNETNSIFCHAVSVRKQIHGVTIGAVISPKEFRGKGYGKKCIYAISKKLLEDGYSFITLHVSATNEPAKNVYEKVGFEFIEETERLFLN